jgi:hypothetical protein
MGRFEGKVGSTECAARHLEDPAWEGAPPRFTSLNPQGVPHIDVADVPAVVLFFAAEEARHVTGAVFDVSGEPGSTA